MPPSPPLQGQCCTAAPKRVAREHQQQGIALASSPYLQPEASNWVINSKYKQGCLQGTCSDLGHVNFCLLVILAQTNHASLSSETIS